MSEAKPVHVGRRRFFLGGAGALVAAGAINPLSWPVLADHRDDDDDDDGGDDLRVVPVPEPIAGGPAPGIHIFLPGPTNITLPFSGLTLQGLDVEPNTITNFRGTAAVAYIIGEALGSDGTTYGLEADVRAYEGVYVAAGARHEGAFVFV
jgi:hypothetical protein